MGYATPSFCCLASSLKECHQTGSPASKLAWSMSSARPIPGPRRRPRRPAPVPGSAPAPGPRPRHLPGSAQKPGDLFISPSNGSISSQLLFSPLPRRFGALFRGSQQLRQSRSVPSPSNRNPTPTRLSLLPLPTPSSSNHCPFDLTFRAVRGSGSSFALIISHFRVLCRGRRFVHLPSFRFSLNQISSQCPTSVWAT